MRCVWLLPPPQSTQLFIYTEGHVNFAPVWKVWKHAASSWVMIYRISSLRLVLLMVKVLYNWDSCHSAFLLFSFYETTMTVCLEWTTNPEIWPNPTSSEAKCTMEIDRLALYCSWWKKKHLIRFCTYDMDLEVLLDALPHGSQGGDAEGRTNKRARSSAGFFVLLLISPVFIFPSSLFMCVCVFAGQTAALPTVQRVPVIVWPMSSTRSWSTSVPACGRACVCIASMRDYVCVCVRWLMNQNFQCNGVVRQEERKNQGNESPE